MLVEEDDVLGEQHYHEMMHAVDDTELQVKVFTSDHDLIHELFIVGKLGQHHLHQHDHVVFQVFIHYLDECNFFDKWYTFCVQMGFWIRF